MSLTRIIVEKAGPLTTIQERGRTGYMRFGVPHSGPIDRLAFAAANAGIGNKEGAALIEVSLGGISLVCAEGSVGFCVCGGDFTAEVEGSPLGSWATGILHAGMRLRIKEGALGNWAYLAFGGDLLAPSWLGSRATHLLAGLGGGRVGTGREIIVEAAPLPKEAHALPKPELRPIEDAMIVMGPQDRYFPETARSAVTGSPFTASAKFDRMGRVMEGQPLVPERLDIASEPAVRGSLQIDGEGRLTILLADHQTIGGYPKIATVVGSDVDRIAQLPTGAALRFHPVPVEEATARWRNHAEAARRYLADAATGWRPFGERLMASNLIDGVVDASR
ncbi:5-oxoprolinase subunit C family protein [Sphingosinicella rhizophila]|uniref:Biotin-dependent carboxyltransferase family protein n=1 Tax=Sphingosinicella rhizophila TaxID=3050082 RepID=A0ABU3Q708_9SPHN|nr:biotin-dependent carboxyltransferase family protein [Sphingosinicella sp. GR2756]MDT9598768.1 biotin-dependent carboxyltransferase family protein [Sphingosinicella sp. GR2756]